LLADKTYTETKISLASKVRDYALFIKLRLASLVVISAIAGYLLAAGTAGVDSTILFYLIVGGFLITGSSNGFNQIIERDLDKKMDRTKNRPLPKGTMSVTEGMIIAIITGIAGVSLLWMINPLSGILGILALFLYVAIYTPLKRITPLAVFVGAFPGAIPPMLGWVAHSGTFGLEAGILFAVQFMWQFPHFWAIAWVLHDDYKKGGFSLLPSKGGRDDKSAFQIMLYSLFMIPAALLPWWWDITGNVSAFLVVLAGVAFALPAMKLYRTRDNKDARRVMFFSFIYLPVVLFIYVFDKV
jgi:protoheme IX farnesyltransferase